MSQSPGSDSDTKDTPGIAAAVIEQFKEHESSLKRRLQYYAETKKRYEMDEEIREIKFFLDVVNDERMVKNLGVAQLQSFLSKIDDIDYKHPIPDDWIPKTRIPRPSRNPLRREQHNNHNERRGVPGNKNGNEFDLSRSRERRRFHRHAPAAAGSSSTTTRDRSESGGRRREWDEETTPQGPQQSRSRSRASFSRAERRTQRLPSNELSDGFQHDDNSRESGNLEDPRYDVRESHWLSDSRPQTFAHFPSGSANNYITGHPYPAPILHIENSGPNSTINIYNAPPPSLNQFPNNVSGSPAARRTCCSITVQYYFSDQEI